jgi:16S rRNA (guanine(1405)-N(7))-methyltransferase
MKNDELSRMNKQLDRLLEVVLKSPKYRNVCGNLIENIGRRQLSKGQDLKTAVKSTKNKLHQIGGAYFLQKPNYGLWLEKLTYAKKSGSENLFRKTCAEIMTHHYSTKQRLEFLDQFYAKIFSSLPSVHSIMDIACGFNPLSLPWMPLAGEISYYAYDVYKDLTGFLNDFMAIANVHGHAEARDIVQDMPKIKTDLAFVLNAIPCFEQIEKSAGLRILESIDARFLVVSFPVQSLGGKEKSMRRYYKTSFNKLRQGKDWLIEEISFETELVFLVTKN